MARRHSGELVQLVSITEEFEIIIYSVFRDVAMFLRDPYALNAVCTSILKCLTQLYENYKLPRVSPQVNCCRANTLTYSEISRHQ